MPDSRHPRLLVSTARGEVIIELTDNPTAAALRDLLPLEVEVEDFHRTEKTAHLPERLPTDGAPPSYQASAGDLTYYSPWGNLALFYRDFDAAPGLVHLGHVVAGADPEVLGGPARIELSEGE